MNLRCGIALLLVASGAAGTRAQPLAWDAVEKDYVAKAGETTALIRFHFKNVSAVKVTINHVTTSCGCTVAKIPREPWILEGGEEGDIDITVDLRGKYGRLTKTVTVQMPGTFENLAIRLHLPNKPPDAGRAANQAVASADRQAVFKGACAACHLEPLKQKTGVELYAAACGICHEARERASMVPALAGIPNTTDEFWRSWITTGKAGTLMPAFGREAGGPLDSGQIESLVRLLAAGKGPGR